MDKVVFLKMNVNNIKIDRSVKIKIFIISSVFGRKLKITKWNVKMWKVVKICHHHYKQIKSVEEKLVFVQQNYKVDALNKKIIAINIHY